MNIKTLTIYVENNEKTAANIGEADAPQLFAAFKSWQDAKRGSSQESHLWNRVLEVAAEYLSETGDYLDTDGVEVSDVTGFAKDEDEPKPVPMEPVITFCFDRRGGFFAKSTSEAGTLIEYAYASSPHADEARKNPAEVANRMVGDTSCLECYKKREWWAAHIAHMQEQMDIAAK